MRLDQWTMAHQLIVDGWGRDPYRQVFRVGVDGVVSIEARPEGAVITHESGRVAVVRDGWGCSAPPAMVAPQPEDSAVPPKRKRGRPRKQPTTAPPVADRSDDE